MTDLTHDTFKGLDRGTPALFTWSARILPFSIGVQFLLAGHALFAGMSWDMHGIVGGLIGLIVLAIAGLVLGIPRLRGFGWWAGVILALYIFQIGLGAAGPSALAFHPFNAALLLAASLVLLFKVERRRARSAVGPVWK